MDIECTQIWRNFKYDDLFDELRERYENLAMEIPKKDLKKLPQEWMTGKITFDPADVTTFYSYIENPEWTCACIAEEWFMLDIKYDQLKEFRKLSLDQEHIEISELLDSAHEQPKKEEQVTENPTKDNPS
jgi:hypothetical protein